MNTNSRRPDGWTSADAAGLAILPGLVRYDEVYDPNAEIRHALRVTVRATNGYLYPASHRAGSTAGALPMGARLRLKASVDITQRTSDPNVQKIFRAMQKYGLIVADNGSDMEQATIPPNLDYAKISGLSHEVCEKLVRIKPQSLGQAARIPGITPAAISLLSFYIKKSRRS